MTLENRTAVVSGATGGIGETFKRQSAAQTLITGADISAILDFN